MKVYGVNELRKMYLDFFESKGHLKLNSFSLVPQNDKSLLLINSGMAPLKPYFTGQEIPPKKRVTTCQKCIRTGDIENIGKTARHGTFFEMLGNFSFGDYFKHEAIAWSWEFLTEVVGLSGDRLYPSIYLEDDEAFDIWNKEVGIAPERIFRMGKADNFWEHGAGPCGPCSEIYYDRGEKYGCGDPNCTVGCECDRFIEVWNNVFTQFNSDGNGNYEELENKNIDTGMGLERLAVVVQDVDTLFDIDTMKAIRDHVCKMANAEYKVDPKKDMSIRLITDHIRSVTFMTSDGIIPSNEGRGYVLRRLLRRAARHGRLLGIQGKFLAELSKTVIAESKDGYPELEEKKEYILKVLTIEEEKFNKTIDQGLSILSEMEEALVSNGTKTLNGEDAFKLYDTYGFPLDLTKEILEEKGFSIDEEGFKKAMQVQRETARSARAVTNYMGADASIYDEIDPAITSNFVGYDRTSHTSKISVLTTETDLTDEVVGGQTATIIVDETPFYATMGGQTADIGFIVGKDAEFEVEDTIKLKGGRVGHLGTVTKGSFKVGETVTLTIDTQKRQAIGKNHSATHLLQKALRNVLGSHVEQAGSFVTSERLRFDFTHFSALTKEEIAKVEAMVNEEIAKNVPVVTDVMSVEDAKKSGAMALFGEKYGDSVRVVTMGDFSKELCGGTHVANTGSITVFKILSEAGIAAGVRRIEAITSNAVFEYYKSMEEELHEAAKVAKTEPASLVKRIESLQEELKTALSENEKLKAKLANNSLGDVMNQVVEVKGVKLLASKVTDADMNGLRNLGDQLKEKLGECVILLASASEDKVNLIAMATDGAMAKGAHAGNLIKEVAVLVGGGGGGRPNMAQAGGKNPSGIDAAIEKAVSVVENQIK
ncbi:alanine--tRNA ligase [Lachnoclostridium phytofermentans]|uniref:Alanine--tRNA ligase 1 n=1 Tax=Lachnoclostridium phytofermentans (strain ATCC 700394 / DSM 18823 / ISDg) TaxID=357809 RepID=SYA1_LACP7|nr:alanine--tRNA ligase [Lachnoclostridium phytofermentans]A9KMW7.1 RecName: Full=Alanine--tRNA ligase 1; AltName: Full=Alanyl-tRNA synthetase 1; Short=AlaRS 1 [Lachnoclostridium phytofermentans ISDg]ABX42978.1 alanyl-tRNA synthetase [Lachnoclostridium phytofermentans ISDg]